VFVEGGTPVPWNNGTMASPSLPSSPSSPLLRKSFHVIHVDMMLLNRKFSYVRFVGSYGVGEFNPPLVEDYPLTGDCKVWSGSDSTLSEGQNSKFVVN